MQVTILTEAEIRQYVEMDQEAIAVVEEGFTRLADGEVTVPPIVCVDIKSNPEEAQ